VGGGAEEGARTATVAGALRAAGSSCSEGSIMPPISSSSPALSALASASVARAAAGAGSGMEAEEEEEAAGGAEDAEVGGVAAAVGVPEWAARVTANRDGSKQRTSLASRLPRAGDGVQTVRNKPFAASFRFALDLSLIRMLGHQGGDSATTGDALSDQKLLVGRQIREGTRGIAARPSPGRTFID